MSTAGRKFKRHTRVAQKTFGRIAILAEKGVIQCINNKRWDLNIFYEVKRTAFRVIVDRILKAVEGPGVMIIKF